MFKCLVSWWRLILDRQKKGDKWVSYGVRCPQKALDDFEDEMWKYVRTFRDATIDQVAAIPTLTNHQEHLGQWSDIGFMSPLDRQGSRQVGFSQ